MSELSSESSVACSGVAVDTLDEPDLERALAGDDDAFTRLVEPLRRELHAHGYRMLGSAHDADDALQDALVRAWRGLPQFEGRSSLRTWLYSVVTRACLDLLRSRKRRALPIDLSPASERVVVHDTPLTDVAWLGPYADTALLEGLGGPEARYEQREAVELAFVAALQHLPGNQRAALVLFDVLGFSAAEIAEIMQTSVASVNSARQRARAVVSDTIPAESQQETRRRVGDAGIRRLVAGFADAMERGDVDALVGLLSEDVTWSMPPLPHWYAGRDRVADFAAQVPLTSCGAWRHVPTRANGQAAVASYVWRDETQTYERWSINVFTLAGDRIAAITSFLGAEHFDRLGLPDSLG